MLEAAATGGEEGPEAQPARAAATIPASAIAPQRPAIPTCSAPRPGRLGAHARVYVSMAPASKGSNKGQRAEASIERRFEKRWAIEARPEVREERITRLATSEALA